MKIIHWIQVKIIKFLGIDMLENRLNERCRLISTRLTKCENEIESIDNTLRSIVSIGADIYRAPDDHSWAVICIEGNFNIVKFIDMKGADYKYILAVLKQFEKSRNCIDAPPGFMYKDIFRF